MENKKNNSAGWDYRIEIFERPLNYSPEDEPIKLVAQYNLHGGINKALERVVEFYEKLQAPSSLKEKGIKLSKKAYSLANELVEVTKQMVQLRFQEDEQSSSSSDNKGEGFSMLDYKILKEIESDRGEN